MPLNISASRQGMLARLAEPLNSDLQTVAAGIFDVLIAKTVGAIRAITVERGKDPREFSLLAFGGAGPMIAPMIAREVGAVEVIVPNVPAAFSAWGMLMSDLVLEVAQTDVLTSSQQDWPRVEANFATLESQARGVARRTGCCRGRPDDGSPRGVPICGTGARHCGSTDTGNDRRVGGSGVQ